MKEPLWVTVEVILAVQEELLARFGGLARLRDEGLLDSALNRLNHLFHLSTSAHWLLLLLLLINLLIL